MIKEHFNTKGYIAVLDEHLDVEVTDDDDPVIVHVHVLAENDIDGSDVKGCWNVQQQQVC